jgi:hypothetical protein
VAQLTAALAAGEPRAAQNSYSLFDRQDAGGVQGPGAPAVAARQAPPAEYLSPR